MDEGATGNNLLTLDEVAEVLKVHRETVRWYIQLGKLKGIKIGYRTIRVHQKDLDDFIKSHRGHNYFKKPKKGQVQPQN